MLNTTFLKNKINRQIKQNGQRFTFVRYKEDQYHQVSSVVDQEIDLEGIFHTTNNYITKNTDDGSASFSKPQPMILTSYEYGLKILPKDEVKISNQKYIVIDKNNVNSFNVAFDISLELVK